MQIATKGIPQVIRTPDRLDLAWIVRESILSGTGRPVPESFDGHPERTILMSNLPHVYDDVLIDPHGYREATLEQQFGSVSSGRIVFHGITSPPNSEFADWFNRLFPHYLVTLSFLRRSPEGQKEPNFIHNDTDMGEVTALMYLNPDPPQEDGTSFWQYKATGRGEGPPLSGEVGQDLNQWDRWLTVPAVFNRAVVFDAPLFHSRAIESNYDCGEQARLFQVLFARRKGQSQ